VLLLDKKKPLQRAAFLEQRSITWQQVQQVLRLEQLLRQQVQRQEPMRQQLVLVQQLELVLQLGLLFCRKLPERKLQRSLPKRVICSFFDTLINVRKQFFEKVN
jgi:hypothetical protein